MKSLLFPLALACLAYPALGTATEASPKDFTFRFAPPDGTKVTRQYRLSRERQFGNLAPQREEVESTTTGQFQRRGEDYHFSTRTVASTMRRDGRAVSDPLTGLLANLEVTYVTDGNGRAREVQGFSGLAATIKQSFPPEVASKLAHIVSEESLVSREKVEWDARYAEFANGAFAVGDVIDAKALTPLPGGAQVEYVIRTTFPGWEPCPAGQCIRIVQVYESDTDALNATFNKTLSAIASSKGDMAPLPSMSSDARITGSLSRLIDPATMLIYSERVKRDITMRMDIPGQGSMPVVVREQRSYDYAYE